MACSCKPTPWLTCKNVGMQRQKTEKNLNLCLGNMDMTMCKRIFMSCWGWNCNGKTSNKEDYLKMKTASKIKTISKMKMTSKMKTTLTSEDNLKKWWGVVDWVPKQHIQPLIPLKVANDTLVWPIWTFPCWVGSGQVGLARFGPIVIMRLSQPFSKAGALA